METGEPSFRFYALQKYNTSQADPFCLLEDPLSLDVKALHGFSSTALGVVCLYWPCKLWIFLSVLYLLSCMD